MDSQNYFQDFHLKHGNEVMCVNAQKARKILCKYLNSLRVKIVFTKNVYARLFHTTDLCYGTCSFRFRIKNSTSPLLLTFVRLLSSPWQRCITKYSIHISDQVIVTANSSFAKFWPYPNVEVGTRFLDPRKQLCISEALS